ncbi:MAG TPA: hypothetical protein VEI99_02995 [Terriglobales bacterium]|nr:hypothetical protein [Terriglobales bacterium]
MNNIAQADSRLMEFATAPAASRKLIPAMFLFFLLGLGSIAIAPVVTR